MHKIAAGEDMFQVSLPKRPTGLVLLHSQPVRVLSKLISNDSIPDPDRWVETLDREISGRNKLHARQYRSQLQEQFRFLAESG